MKTESGEVIRVIITDDHLLYRSALKAALSSKKDIKIIAEADNGAELLTLLERVHPDVILLDIQMPVMDGITVLPEVKKTYPDVRVIMLTMMDDPHMMIKLMERGASSYLLKTADSEIIYEAIKSCYKQGFYITPAADKPMPAGRRDNSPSPVLTHPEDLVFSEKEITVLRLLTEAKSIREIAEKVGLSPHFIEVMRDDLMIKTGTKSTAGLIIFALRNNLLGEDA